MAEIPAVGDAMIKVIRVAAIYGSKQHDAKKARKKKETDTLAAADAAEKASTEEEKAEAAAKQAAAAALPNGEPADDATVIEDLTRVARDAGCPESALDRLCSRQNLMRLAGPAAAVMTCQKTI